MTYVYEITKGRLDGYRGIVEVSGRAVAAPGQIGECVSAALAIREKISELKDWDGAGEYWWTAIPSEMPQLTAIIVRPGPNPYASGYVVSPVPMPWLEKEAAK